MNVSLISRKNIQKYVKLQQNTLINMFTLIISTDTATKKTRGILDIISFEDVCKMFEK